MRKFLLASVFCLLPIVAQAALETGKPVPDFTATAIDGSKVKPSDYTGKIVVLEWNNPGCPFVHKFYDQGAMQKLQSWAEAKGVVWLTVDSAAQGKEGSMTPAEAKAYLAKVKARPTHYILDADGTIGKLYGAKSTPHMFVIDAKGDLAYMGAIDDQPTPDPASLAKADNYVKDAIESLLAGKPVAVASTQSYGCSVKYGD